MPCAKLDSDRHCRLTRFTNEFLCFFSAPICPGAQVQNFTINTVAAPLVQPHEAPSSQRARQRAHPARLPCIWEGEASSRGRALRKHPSYWLRPFPQTAPEPQYVLSTSFCACCVGTAISGSLSRRLSSSVSSRVYIGPTYPCPCSTTGD